MPSKLLVVHIPATAGNVQTDIAAPAAGHKYRFLGFLITQQNDATVASRTFNFNFYVAGTTDKVFPSLSASTALTANQGGSYGVSPLLAPTGGTAFAHGCANHAGSPGSLVIDSGITMNINITNGVAGDSYSGHVLLEDIAP